MQGQNHKVLLVDDDGVVRRLLGDTLSEAGYDVTTVDCGQRALELIAESQPDFLITDWLMPGLTGLDVCRKVRGMDLDGYLYTLILTGKSSAKDAVLGLEAGADDYLTKPVDHEELLARLRAGARILELERRLSQLAQTDPLTGIPTQRTFAPRATNELIRCSSSNQVASVVMLDIDFFKKVNDVHGHAVGDMVLKVTADLLSQHCEPQFPYCRQGGEEFCVLLPELNEGLAVLWADRIRQELKELCFPVSGESISVTASFGVAQWDRKTSRLDKLLEHADEALLLAKNLGRDCVMSASSVDPLDSEGIVNEGDLDMQHWIAQASASDCMTPLVARVRNTDSLSSAARLMMLFSIPSVPVINNHGELVGILSEKDLLNVITCSQAWKFDVGHIMKTNVISYTPDTPLKIIYEFLCRVNIRSVVILENNHPVGVISRGSLVRWQQNLRLSHQLAGEAGLEAVKSDKERLLDSANQSMAATVTSIEEQLGMICEAVACPSEDTLPICVSSTSRIQELSNYFLTYSRGRWSKDTKFLDEPVEATFQS